MVFSSDRGLSPRPAESAPCGSRSTRRTFFPRWASADPKLITVVVFPTPPFCWASAMILQAILRLPEVASLSLLARQATGLLVKRQVVFDHPPLSFYRKPNLVCSITL